MLTRKSKVYKISTFADWEYFGPPLPDGSFSPYWPLHTSWNIAIVKQNIGHNLGDLRRIVENGPYKGLPRTLKCACPGSNCLLGILDTYCDTHNIVRIDVPVINVDIDNKYIQLIPYIATDKWHLLLMKFSIIRMNVLRAKIVKDRERVCEAWDLDDIETLCELVTDTKTSLWVEFVDAVARV